MSERTNGYTAGIVLTVLFCIWTIGWYECGKRVADVWHAAYPKVVYDYNPDGLPAKPTGDLAGTIKQFDDVAAQITRNMDSINASITRIGADMGLCWNEQKKNWFPCTTQPSKARKPRHAIQMDPKGGSFVGMDAPAICSYTDCSQVHGSITLPAELEGIDWRVKLEPCASGIYQHHKDTGLIDCEAAPQPEVKPAPPTEGKRLWKDVDGKYKIVHSDGREETCPYENGTECLKWAQLQPEVKPAPPLKTDPSAMMEMEFRDGVAWIREGGGEWRRFSGGGDPCDVVPAAQP
jgi:hypothetical protein